MEGDVFLEPVYKLNADGHENNWLEPDGWRIRLSINRMPSFTSDRVYKTQDGAEKAAIRWLNRFPHVDWGFW
jgi:hypothetical protein